MAQRNRFTPPSLRMGYEYRETPYFYLIVNKSKNIVVDGLVRNGRYSGRGIRSLSKVEIENLASEMKKTGLLDHGSLAQVLDRYRPTWRSDRVIRTKRLVAEIRSEGFPINVWLRKDEVIGRRVAELSVEDVMQLRHTCEATDAEGYRILCEYLGWAVGDEEVTARYKARCDRLRWAYSDVEWEERVEWARSILETIENASVEEIKERSRILKQKIHPDKNGSNLLFQYVDEAFNVLLEDESKTKSPKKS